MISCFPILKTIIINKDLALLYLLYAMFECCGEHSLSLQKQCNLISFSLTKNCCGQLGLTVLVNRWTQDCNFQMFHNLLSHPNWPRMLLVEKQMEEIYFQSSTFQLIMTCMLEYMVHMLMLRYCLMMTHYSAQII